MNARFLLPLAFALLLSACGTQPSRFYQLTATPLPESGTTAPGRVVGLERVGVPGYLDRSEIVMRGSGSRLSVLEFDRWAGAIDGMMTRTLAQNLSAELGNAEVVELPVMRDVPLAQVVEVQIDRFDAAENGPAVLEARWRIFGQGGDRLNRFGRTVAQEPVAAPGDPGTVADALSRTLARLARDIAGALRAGV